MISPSPSTLSSRQSLLFFVYFHIGTRAHSTDSQGPQTLPGSKLDISKTTNRKWETRNTVGKRQNKWVPSCRTLSENEQWLIQVGSRQREGKNEAEIVYQLPKCHQAVTETLAESKLWRGEKKRKCYIGFSSFLQHLGLIYSSGLVQSAYLQSE